MSGPGAHDQSLRETAYYIWEQEGRPAGRAWDHWLAARARLRQMPPPGPYDPFEEEMKILAGRHDVNMQALLTRDVAGG